MSNVTPPTTNVHHHAERAAHHVSPWVEYLARAGYAAKGVLYCVIGLLAALAAFVGGANGDVTGSKGALRQLQDWPFGQVLLALMAVGLVGYALWRFVQALLDPEHEGDDAKALAKRAGWFVVGLIHAALVFYVVGLLTGTAQGGNEGGRSGAESWTATFMSWPLGPWLVGIAGLAVAGFGLYEIYKAWVAKLDDQLNLSTLDPDTRRWVEYVSRFGIAARGVVFVIIGVFLVVAAVRTNPNRAKGLEEALETLQTWPAGWLLLGVIALGLIAYGIYEFLEAYYRRIQVRG